MILLIVAGIAVAIEYTAIIVTECLMVAWLTGNIEPWRTQYA